MNYHVSPSGGPQGQATFGMSNLRKEKTGLPFVVFISQKDGAQHDVRVKVSASPKVVPGQMSSYSLRPFELREGSGLTSAEESLLQDWIELNRVVIVDYWDGAIEYTEDAVAAIKPI